MRTVFLGTPGDAVPSLRALSRISDIDLVVTRPDAQRGRHRRLHPPPVKEAALDLGLEVAQPGSGEELLRALEHRSIDVGVVVAFGMILRPPVLALPKHGFVNVHFSLLPRWRGAAPVERSIMAGDEETGVTIMLMDEGLDTGPVLAREATEIEYSDTGGSLRRRLATLGATLLAETLPLWVTGDVEPRRQTDDGATYAARLQSEDRLLATSMGAREAWNAVRALSPDIGAQLEIEGVRHKILGAGLSPATLAPGEWTTVEGSPVLGFADGSVELTSIQPPGKRAMSGADWLRGRSLPG